MKHPASFFFFIICNFHFAAGQWNIPQVVGHTVYPKGSTSWSSEVIIHPEVASGVPVGHFEESHSFNWGYYSVTDPKNLRYFLMMGPSDSPKLYTLDLKTGSLLSKVNLPDSNFYWWGSFGSTILYDTKTDRLFALLKKDIYVNTDSCWLITVDPMNGNIDTMKNLGYGLFHLVHAGIDESKNVMYCIKQEVYFGNHLTLLKIHLDDFTIDEIPIEESDYHFNYFQYGYHCRTGVLYGVEAYGVFGQPYQSGDFRIATIEPQSGARTVLSDIKTNCYLEFGAFSMMPFNDKFYFHGSHITSATTGITSVFCFDMMTNEISDKSWTGNYASPVWTSYVPHSTSASFSAQNFCLHGTTQFSTSPNDAFNYEWNFGDNDSKGNNLSYESNPSHVFTDTGVYNVTLITSTCYHSDTVSQWIHIDEFPPLDLGADTSICPDRIGGEILLHVKAPENGTIQWQDYSSDSFFTVTAPGVYYVTVTGDCGAITDSITVASGDCNCPMKIIPDLTSNSVTLEIGCSLANYPQIRGDVFNMLGQRVLEFVPASESYQFPVSQLSAGQYIVVVTDGNNRLMTQKIVLVH